MYKQSKAHMIHRCLRFRLKSEVASIKLVRGLDLAGTTMLDIGANRGVYSIYMSRAAGPAGKVIAFEAQPELGPHLETVKQQFSLQNLDIVSEGLSSTKGTLTMRRTEVGSGGATFGTLGEAAIAEDIFDVPVTTLDDYMQKHPELTISFIKCDVEGHELSVFKGGRAMLSRDLPVLLFEGHDSELDDGALSGYLSELGYDGFFFYVDPADHASIFHKGRGYYVPYSGRLDYAHCRPGVEHRNYVFVKAGTTPEDYLKKTT